jgi:hypothetical protein
MSRTVRNNSDIARLIAEGHDVRIADGALVVARVPYVTSSREVAYGVLVTDLTLSGDVTDAPSGTHVMHFAGEYPCNAQGTPLEGIRHAEVTSTMGGQALNFSFSSKPPRGHYLDYYEKVTAYARILVNEARVLEPEVSAGGYVIEVDDEDSVFRYPDSATTRAGIEDASQRIAGQRLAVIGAGGTGSYLVDLIAKSPVAEIHIFDADDFLTHNAFRAPGAASLQALRRRPAKVAYLEETYAAMRRGVVAHPEFINEDNLGELDGFDFVFLAIDDGEEKRLIVQRLRASGTPFIDAGLGIDLTDDNKIRGQIRVTTSTTAKSDHVEGRVPAGDALNDEYATNIQVAELNALAAALAVIRWKKHFGFYEDLELDHHAVYVIDGNNIVNEDPA